MRRTHQQSCKFKRTEKEQVWLVRGKSKEPAWLESRARSARWHWRGRLRPNHAWSCEKEVQISLERWMGKCLEIHRLICRTLGTWFPPLMWGALTSPRLHHFTSGQPQCWGPFIRHSSKVPPQDCGAEASKLVFLYSFFIQKTFAFPFSFEDITNFNCG